MNSQFSHRALLRRAFGKAGHLDTAVTSLFVGVSSTAPTITGGNVTEPAAGGYARVEVPAAGWNDATDATPSIVTNDGAIVFPQATADWLAGVNLAHAVIYDAASGGNFIGRAEVTSPKGVLSGDTLRIADGELSFSLNAAS